VRQAGASGQWITGVVLAAGASKRLGQAKQLLPYGGAPLLGHVLQTARGCPFDQLLCVVGGASAEVRRWVDLRGVEVVENEAAGLHGDKGLWKLMDRLSDDVVEVEMEGSIPLDVDTWDDYRRVLLAAAYV